MNNYFQVFTKLNSNIVRAQIKAVWSNVFSILDDNYALVLFYVHTWSDVAQNLTEFLHHFDKSMIDEYLDRAEERWSPILQHKYLMQSHLELFLKVEVGTPL